MFNPISIIPSVRLIGVNLVQFIHTYYIHTPQSIPSGVAAMFISLRCYLPVEIADTRVF